jgi:hypothetical protein
VPYFLTLIALLYLTDKSIESKPNLTQEMLEETKEWIAFITAIATGLLVWISNNNKKDE